MLTQVFMLALNPEQWRVGTTGVRNTLKGYKSYLSPVPELVNYQNAVKQELKGQVRKVIDVECSMDFYFWRRLDRYGTGNGNHMRHVADATNLQKALEDALQGVLVTNDQLVRRVTSEVVEQTPDALPGIIIVASTPYHSLWHATLDQKVIDEFHAMRADAESIDLGNIIS